MTAMLSRIRETFLGSRWFTEKGAYVLVDGQYGSTGKGALAALISATVGDRLTVVTTNAGPNSGHTGYYRQDESSEPLPIITRQIPVAGVMCDHPVLVYLNGGAIIDPKVLKEETDKFGPLDLWVHPNAAIIDPEYMDDVPSLRSIASTGKGVGQALARKVLREPNVAKFRRELLNDICNIKEYEWDWCRDVVFVETAQGFSLGINSSFYPFTTSRECTVQQAITDARIPHNKVRKVIMSLRTYPIRVGDTADGTSGGCYSDQEEVSWSQLGVDPELTTVTKRVRRIFTWSRQQFCDALRINQPNALFLNFCQYVQDDAWSDFVAMVHNDYHKIMGGPPDFILYGWGPRPEDVTTDWRRK